MPTTLGRRAPTTREMLAAAREIIFGLVEPDLVPRSTLRIRVPSGSQGFTPLDPSIYAPGGIAIYEDTGEMVGIHPDWDGESVPIPMTFRSGAQRGTSDVHQAGAVVSTNLLIGGPPSAETFVSGGLPFIFLYPLEDRTYLAAQLENQVDYTIGFTLIRRMVQPSDQAGVNMVLWALDQQEAVAADVDRIRAAISTNPTLTTSTGTWALNLGDSVNPQREHFLTQYQQIIVSKEIQDYGAECQFIVRAKRETLAPTG